MGGDVSSRLRGSESVFPGQGAMVMRGIMYHGYLDTRNMVKNSTHDHDMLRNPRIFNMSMGSDMIDLVDGHRVTDDFVNGHLFVYIVKMSLDTSGDVSHAGEVERHDGLDNSRVGFVVFGVDR